MDFKLEEKLKNEFINYTGDKKINEYFCLKDDLLLYWSEKDKCLLATSTRNGFGAKYQKLICSLSPSFRMKEILVNDSGNYVLAYGDESIAVVELPRIWGSEGLFENGKESIYCRMWLIGESLFNCQSSNRVLKVRWFDSVSGHGHIVLLTSDNCLRFYNVAMPDKAVGVIPLFDQGYNDSSKYNSIYNMTCKVLGITAVDFDFGCSNFNRHGMELHQVYVLQESGDVWVVKFSFDGESFSLKQQAQMAIKPHAEDNYGCEYCALICLPLQPSVIALGKRNGEIYHSVVFSEDENEEERIEDNSINFYPDESLFIFESIQIDLSYLDENSLQEDSILSSMKLNKGLSTLSHSYFCVSDAGLHVINLPWIKEFQHFLKNEEELVLDDSLEKPAEVSYLLCTQPFEESANTKICGCVQMNSHPFIQQYICLLSNGAIVHVNDNRLTFDIEDENETVSNNTSLSSDVNKQRTGDFDRYIASILQKKVTVPIVRTDKNEETIPAETYYRLLSKTTKMLREEYMQKLLLAKVELQKRYKLLAVKREDQMKSVNELLDDSDIQLKSEELGLKLETVAENMSFIAERTSKVLRQIHFSAPVLSHAEETWAKELREIQKKLVTLKRYKEHVVTRHENSILSDIPSTVKKHNPRNTSIGRKDTLPTGHMIKLRAVLKEQGDKISTLVNEVQSLNISVGR